MFRKGDKVIADLSKFSKEAFDMFGIDVYKVYTVIKPETFHTYKHKEFSEYLHHILDGLKYTEPKPINTTYCIYLKEMDHKTPYEISGWKLDPQWVREQKIKKLNRSWFIRLYYKIIKKCLKKVIE